MGKSSTHTYIVEGRGEFPFDMLRRERSFPADSTSAMLMGTDSLGNVLGRRRIAITTDEPRFISARRWLSFGWTIVGGFDWGFPSEIDYQKTPVGMLETTYGDA